MAEITDSRLVEEDIPVEESEKNVSQDGIFSGNEDMPESVYLGEDSTEAETVEAIADIQEEEGQKDESAMVDEKVMAAYEGKNEFLRNHPDFRELDPRGFLYTVFCRGEQTDILPFEEEWCEAYEWWAKNPRDAKRPPEYSYVYNGIAQAIYGKKRRQKEDKKNKTFVLTSDASRLNEILSHPFVIMSPISYTGKRRLKNNARYLYAIAIDIDEADAQNIDNLIYQSDPTRPHITFPQPNIIVNSGHGIHVYYLLETPQPLFDNMYEILNKVKRELTRRVWNKGTTHLNPEKPQYQGNCQGFRFPGTKTKFGQTVTAFLNINPNVKPYYQVEDLAYNGGGWLSDDELKMVRNKDNYNPERVTLKQARALWPEWYERRIVQGHSPGRWYIKRDLYDWWKRKMTEHATVGHRYFCMMGLAIYAIKCNIPQDEFEADLKKYTEIMDGLSYTRNPEDRFTIEDAQDAAVAFRESYCTFPIDDIRSITGVPVERNKTRKGHKQKDHLRDARSVRDGRCKEAGVTWRQNGRSDKFKAVHDWQAAHPNGTKYACARELGINKITVKKWWNVTPEEAENMRKWRPDEPHSLKAVRERTSYPIPGTYMSYSTKDERYPKEVEEAIGKAILKNLTATLQLMGRKWKSQEEFIDALRDVKAGTDV